ncbi:MAG: hypothetical protein EZS28_018620 [Streblomastix strix]|uniref:Uncharacterized protein n=1 Tax=Streblomastix strix TaxID=222440 RepID=A0A5J4VT74_9EUKA|nr:MAG: hypothetical protein EZS28_018620 [Streblomastix strix]
MEKKVFTPIQSIINDPRDLNNYQNDTEQYIAAYNTYFRYESTSTSTTPASPLPEVVYFVTKRQKPRKSLINNQSRITKREHKDLQKNITQKLAQEIYLLSE